MGELVLTIRTLEHALVQKQLIPTGVVRNGHQLSPGASDETLLEGIAKGDPEFLAHLFRRYAERIFAIGRRILRDPTEAEDLVQESFLYIFKKSSLFDSSRGPARSWIFQVAYTQAFLRKRKLTSHGLYATEIADRSLRFEPPTNSASDYDRTVEALFGRNGWRRILQSLTEEQRETLTLHFFEGLTFGEIAEKLGQSHANVRNHHYRGLEKIRKYLAENPSNRR